MRIYSASRLVYYWMEDLGTHAMRTLLPELTWGSYPHNFALTVVVYTTPHMTESRWFLTSHNCETGGSAPVLEHTTWVKPGENLARSRFTCTCRECQEMTPEFVHFCRFGLLTAYYYPHLRQDLRALLHKVKGVPAIVDVYPPEEVL